MSTHTKPHHYSILYHLNKYIPTYPRTYCTTVLTVVHCCNTVSSVNIFLFCTVFTGNLLSVQAVLALNLLRLVIVTIT